MTRSAIQHCVAQVVQEVALANGSSMSITGSTCPADAIVGLDSPQLLHSTGEIARRLQFEIPVKENVFYDGRRPRSIDEIAAHVATFTPAPGGDGAVAPLPSQPVPSSPHV